jgi:hypothetical protein
MRPSEELQTHTHKQTDRNTHTASEELQKDPEMFFLFLHPDVRGSARAWTLLVD